MLRRRRRRTITDVAKLPESFVWGVSSSAFQTEGHTTGSNWNY
jgi:hypothetical protein